MSGSPSSTDLAKRASSTTLPITDQEGDSSYIGLVDIGTPYVNFKKLHNTLSEKYVSSIYKIELSNFQLSSIPDLPISGFLRQIVKDAEHRQSHSTPAHHLLSKVLDKASSWIMALDPPKVQ